MEKVKSQKYFEKCDTLNRRFRIHRMPSNTYYNPVTSSVGTQNKQIIRYVSSQFRQNQFNKTCFFKCDIPVLFFFIFLFSNQFTVKKWPMERFVLLKLFKFYLEKTLKQPLLEKFQVKYFLFE